MTIIVSQTNTYFSLGSVGCSIGDLTLNVFSESVFFLVAPYPLNDLTLIFPLFFRRNY